MPDTEGSSLNPSVPFVLRGSSSVFSRRQLDTFGSLQALEDAHIKVTKATKAERLLVKKMAWRLVKPAVESLAAEKEARDRRNASSEVSNNPFKVPTLLPPRVSKLRASGRRTAHQFTEVPRRDPSKWTHYSLADVDEDAGLGANANRKIASDLMRELRRQREELEGNVDGPPPSSDAALPGRILFRSVSGKKRARLDTSNLLLSSVPTVNSKTLNEDEEEEVLSSSDNRTTFDEQSSTSGIVTFRTRMQRRRQCFGRLSASTLKDSDEEVDKSESVSISSVALEGDNSSDIAAEDSDMDDAAMEDGLEGV